LCEKIHTIKIQNIFCFVLIQRNIQINVLNRIDKDNRLYRDTIVQEVKEYARTFYRDDLADFYEFACGGFLKEISIPDHKTSEGKL
jgi:hypothetical protein